MTRREWLKKRPTWKSAIMRALASEANPLPRDARSMHRVVNQEDVRIKKMVMRFRRAFGMLKPQNPHGFAG